MSTRPDEPAHAPHSPRRPDAGAPDDDPTHALDDFLRRLYPPAGGSAVDGDPTDLSGLSARLHAGSPAPPEGPTARPPAAPAARGAKGGTLRNGERWQADDVTDVPVVELPRVTPAPAAADDPAWHDIGRQAAAAAARHATGASLDADPASAANAWQPDPAALQLRRATDPRLLPHWQPGAWIGAQRQVLQASTEFVSAPAAGGGSLGPLSAPVVESHDAQCLLVLWAPPASAPSPEGAGPLPQHPPCLSRWPHLVLLAPMSGQALAGHAAAASAADAMLAARPAAASEAPLWLNPDPSHVDWALAADIALHHLPELRPFQIEGLRAFIAAEREASFARVNDAYASVPGGALEKGR